MSWLSIPLPNPFKSLQFSDYDEEEIPSDSNQSQLDDNAAAAVEGAGGVKDDLSVISETIGRQLRGVAAFLAPPFHPSESAADDDDDGDYDDDDDGNGGEDSADSSFQTFAGIRSDLAEIGGSFKSSLSLLSTAKAVSELSRFASNLLQLNDDNVGDDDDGDDEGESAAGVGITDEIVQFVEDISLRSECWSDFPLELNDEFNMSPIQAEHASVIEQLVPNLGALRDRLSAGMSDQQFWMIYFILLLPRLDEHDFQLLSTPEIVEARNTLLLMLKNKSNNSGKSQTDTSFQSELNKEEMRRNSSEEKVVLALSSGASVRQNETSERWSEAEDANTGSYSAQSKLKNEDDISFSDLEDDDSDFSNRRSSSGREQFAVASSRDGSNEWVQLNKNVETGGDQQRGGQIKSRDRDSEDDETNDWLAIDDFDPDSLAAA